MICLINVTCGYKKETQFSPSANFHLLETAFSSESNEKTSKMFCFVLFF